MPLNKSLWRRHGVRGQAGWTWRGRRQCAWKCRPPKEPGRSGAAALRRPGGRALGKTAPGPDAESRSDAALPARIPGDAPPSSGRGPTPAPGFSRGLGASLCRKSHGQAVREV